MNGSPAPWRIGVDVGGTFTDVVCIREGREPVVFKVPSTPADPGDAVVLAVERLVASDGVEPGQIVQLAHGTTVATNAVLERKGGRLGVIATEGFRDTLEIGRQMRREMYEIRLKAQTPVFLAPREMRFGVRERVGASGEIVSPLEEDTVVEALGRLVESEAECVAVCLLFSFLNPKHERRVRELARSLHPNLEISLSCEVDPAFREYERTAITAFDAYIKPVVRRYLAALARRLSEAGIETPLQVMQSRGGLANVGIAQSRPVRLFLSGPAAGVIGAQSVGVATGARDLITLDVGGTSSDIALVSDAKPLIRAEGVIAGFPLRVPMVDVNAIGAGGGSIAWLDGAGGLRVGPHSAASEPGPACYSRGGREPTTTDASLVLGLLNPDGFAGGAVRLDPERAREAIRKHIADPLELGVEDAAAGIHRVVNAQMVEGIRLVSVKQGFDPREFSLVAMGGAGPLHACTLAEDLGISRIIVPRHPGVLSAAGLLAAPVEHEVASAFGEPLEGLDLAKVCGVVDALDARARLLMESEGVASDEVEVLHFADVCHIGQGYHLEVPLHVSATDCLARLYADFLSAHERVHGHAVEAAARFVNLRSVHRQRLSRTELGLFSAPAREAANEKRTRADSVGSVGFPRETRRPAGPTGDWPAGSVPDEVAWTERDHAREGVVRHRMVRFPDEASRIETCVVTRDTLAPGVRLTGPAIVEQADTTTLIPPGWRSLTAQGGTMILSPTSESASD